MPMSAAAADMLAALRQSTSDEVLRLAYHAALPVVIDAHMLNLLRVNFFLDPPDALPYEAEATLLLSPLFREIGDDLYEIAPDIRNLLLIGLQTRYGSHRVHQVALLLELYTEWTSAWNAQPELEQAQRLTALSFVDPARAKAWLEDARSGGRAEALGREWFVAMRQRLAAQPQDITIARELATAVEQLSDEQRETRLSAIRALAALAQLPDSDTSSIVTALSELIRTRTDAADRRVAPDVQAALSLMGVLPRGRALLAGLTFVGTDLHDLDLSGGDLVGAQFVECLATGLNLAGTDLSSCHFSNVRADGANLAGADLHNARLENVSLRHANLANAMMADAQLGAVDFYQANLRGATLPGTRETLLDQGVQFDNADLGGAIFQDARPDEEGSLPDPKTTGMRRILIVEDDSSWQDLLIRVLPEYEVDVASSYDEALALLAHAPAYDVAIVDLNLLPSGRDQLGGKVLQVMKTKYPSTRRIAMASSTPVGVRDLFDRYTLDDLLFMQRLDLEDVREVVEASLRRHAVDDVPDKLVIERAKIRNTMRKWKSDTALRMDQRAQTLENDIRDAQRIGQKAEDSAIELETIRNSKQDLEVKYSDFLSLAGAIRDNRDLARVQQEFERLKDLFPS